MGRAAALLSVRAAAFAVLAGTLAAYYATARSWPNVSTWWDVVILAFGVVPAVFGLVYVVLPFWRAPLAQLSAVALALGVTAAAFQHAGLDSLASFAKLGAAAAVAFVFLAVFESASWVALIAALIPWVDAYSVFWGPTSKILKHPKGISALSACSRSRSRCRASTRRRTWACPTSSSSRSSSPPRRGSGSDRASRSCSWLRLSG